MPNFNLEEINYIVTGSRQKILNFDFTGEGGRKEKNVSFFTDNESGTYEPAPLCTSFGYSASSNSNNNEFGFVFLNDTTKVIRSLYDAKDVALKSAVAEQIGLKKNKNDEEGGNERDGQIEIYFPHLKENPLGFAQLQDYGYGMTNKTVIGPVVKRTDLYERKNGVINKEILSGFGNSEWNFFLNPYDKFDSQDYDPGQIPNLIPTYLYTPLSSLQSILFNTLCAEYESMLAMPDVSADTLSSIEDMTIAYTSSYYSFLEFFKERGIDSLSNLFKPVYNFENIEHNYIIEIPLIYTSRLVNINNQYHLALINADTIMAKNILDDIYDTNTSAVGDYRRVREYQGLNVAGNKLFLTYFDDKEYLPDEKFSKGLDYRNYDLCGTVDVSMMKQDTLGKKRDYQKIECIDAINRFVSTTVHKANLFAVRVYGLEKVLNDKKKYSESMKESIKQDIRNGIRRIVDNFVPAHTQYFDVYNSSGDVGIKDLDAFMKQNC